MSSKNTNQPSVLVHALVTRISAPTPAEVKAARDAVALSQADAAKLISPASTKPYRVWQGYETPKEMKGHRAIPLAVWELFLLATNQHPRYRLTVRALSGEP